MSWEGHAQVFCINGHLHGNWDQYGAHDTLCPSCKAPAALENVVDDTNGECDGTLTAEVLRSLLVSEAVIETCNLGHSHITKPEVYRIPALEELDSLQSFWDYEKEVYVRTSERKAFYARLDWQYEVQNGDTKLGFEEWVAHKKEGDDPW